MLGSSLTGRLLVALPVLQDPNFDRTVVLILEHRDEGALGLVLNRPSDTGLDDALPEWGPLAAEPSAVFVGGPVALDGAIGLARSPSVDPAGGWRPLFDQLGTVDLAEDPAAVEVPVEEVRVFVGHAGWGPGQLEDELSTGSWLVADAQPDDALSHDPEQLWPSVLRRQGGRVAWMANFPDDLSVN